MSILPSIGRQKLRKDHTVTPHLLSTSIHYWECTIWREIFAAQNFRGLAAGKDFAKNFFRSSTIAKPRPHWVYANHTYITVMASEFNV